MKFLSIKNQSSQLAGLAKFAALIVAVAFLPACASLTKHVRQADSPLPIQIIDSTGGEFTGTRAFETSDRLYVSGNMRRSFGKHITTSAHVEVQLIGANGRVIADEQDDIDERPPSRSARPWHRQYSYVVSFPLEIARNARSIRVTYHLNQHPDSLGQAQR